MASAGRRPGSTSSRDAVLAAARTLFAARGLKATTMRAVAAEADVNPAMIHHFFGTKEQLFLAALALPLNPAAEITRLRDAGPRSEFAERLVRFFVRTWREPATGQPLQALLRSAVSSEQGATLMRRFVEQVMLPRASAELGVSREQLSAGLAQLLGFALLATVVGAEPLASATEDEVVVLLAPGLQRVFES